MWRIARDPSTQTQDTSTPHEQDDNYPSLGNDIGHTREEKDENS